MEAEKTKKARGGGVEAVLNEILEVLQEIRDGKKAKKKKGE